MEDNIKYLTQALELSELKKIQEQKMVVKEFLNPDTGEIRKKKTADSEVNSGQYIVDDTDYVPLSVLIKRCDRKTLAASLDWFAREDEPDTSDDVYSEEESVNKELADDSLQSSSDNNANAELSPAQGSDTPQSNSLDAVDNLDDSRLK